tara:strand:- start:959 stop:1150 length:192 start_codon:yes stop_codon:yes gene_type:complete
MRPSQVIKRLNELRKVYQEQTFKFTSEQQKEYDSLKEMRRERVKYFYDNDLVWKGGAKKDDTK